MVHHLRRALKRPAVFQIRCDARRPKRMLPILVVISAARVRRWIIA